jgi:hypothetical protein
MNVTQYPTFHQIKCHPNHNTNINNSSTWHSPHNKKAQTHPQTIIPELFTIALNYLGKFETHTEVSCEINI